jgi:hypothetical protein
MAAGFGRSLKSGLIALCLAAAGMASVPGAEAQTYVNHYFGDDIDMNAANDLMIGASGSNFIPGYGARIVMMRGGQGEQISLIPTIGYYGDGGSASIYVDRFTLDSAGGAFFPYSYGGIVPFSNDLVADTPFFTNGNYSSVSAMERRGNEIAVFAGSVKLYRRDSGGVWDIVSTTNGTNLSGSPREFSFTVQQFAAKRASGQNYGVQIHNRSGDNFSMALDDILSTSGYPQIYIDGDGARFAVGYPGYNCSSGGGSTGRVYVYVRNGAAWTRQDVENLTGMTFPSDGGVYSAPSCLGTDISMVGDRIAALDNRGVVYLFQPPEVTGGTQWTLNKIYDARTLIPSGTSSLFRVAMGADKLAVGYSGNPGQGANSGSVLVFNR